MGAPNEDAVVGHRTDGSKFDEPESSSIREETERMKTGLNTILYMARLRTIEQDFRIKPVALADIVHEVNRENKRFYIRSQVYPKFKEIKKASPSKQMKSGCFSSFPSLSTMRSNIRRGKAIQSLFLYTKMIRKRYWKWQISAPASRIQIKSGFSTRFSQEKTDAVSENRPEWVFTWQNRRLTSSATGSNLIHKKGKARQFG